MISADTTDARQYHEVAGAHCQDVNRAKQAEDLVTSLNHELRTPLTSIRAFPTILLNDPDMELSQRRRFLAIVVEEAERLTATLNRLLSD
jgi:signal transduction histidine kinase